MSNRIFVLTPGSCPRVGLGGAWGAEGGQNYSFSNIVCSLTNKRCKRYQTEVLFCYLGHALMVGLGGAGGKKLERGDCDGASSTAHSSIQYTFIPDKKEKHTDCPILLKITKKSCILLIFSALIDQLSPCM